jgi:hypothetical protein
MELNGFSAEFCNLYLTKQTHNVETHHQNFKWGKTGAKK